MIEYSGDCDRMWAFVEDILEEEKDKASMGLPTVIPTAEVDDLVTQLFDWSKDFGEHVNRQLRMHGVVLSRHVYGNVHLRPGGKVYMGVDRGAITDLNPA